MIMGRTVNREYGIEHTESNVAAIRRQSDGNPTPGSYEDARLRDRNC